MNMIRELKKLLEARSKVMQYESIFIDNIYYRIAKNLRPGSTVLDIGGGSAETPVYFAIFPNCSRVLAYEPMERRYRRMLESIAKTPPEIRSKIVARRQAVSQLSGGVLKGTYDREFDGEVEKGLDAVSVAEATLGLRNVAIKCNVRVRSAKVGAEEGIFTEDTDLSNVYLIHIVFFRRLDRVARILKKKGFRVRMDEENLFAIRSNKSMV